jgi:hypothetical protein
VSKPHGKKADWQLAQKLQAGYIDQLPKVFRGIPDASSLEKE